MSKILEGVILVITQEMQKLEARRTIVLNEEKELKTAISELQKMLIRSNKGESK